MRRLKQGSGPFTSCQCSLEDPEDADVLCPLLTVGKPLEGGRFDHVN